MGIVTDRADSYESLKINSFEEAVVILALPVNFIAKKKMAEELLAQGGLKESTARILHLDWRLWYSE